MGVRLYFIFSRIGSAEVKWENTVNRARNSIYTILIAFTRAGLFTDTYKKKFFGLGHQYCFIREIDDG